MRDMKDSYKHEDPSTIAGHAPGRDEVNKSTRILDSMRAEIVTSPHFLHNESTTALHVKCMHCRLRPKESNKSKVINSACTLQMHHNARTSVGLQRCPRRAML
jgi:hypothetical protein